MVGGVPPFRKRSATFHHRSATFKWAEHHLLIFLKGIGAPPFQENERYWSATFYFIFNFNFASLIFACTFSRNSGVRRNCAQR